MESQSLGEVFVRLDQDKQVATIGTLDGIGAAAVVCPLDEQGQPNFYLVNAILAHGLMIDALQSIADLDRIDQPNDDELEYIQGTIREVIPLLEAVKDSSRVFDALLRPSAEPSADTAAEKDSAQPVDYVI